MQWQQLQHLVRRKESLPSLPYLLPHLQEESRVTPAAFEALAGKGSTRKWRQSLTVMPSGQNDQLVTEPIALGDFMKQYQLDRPPSAAGQLVRATLTIAVCVSCSG